MDQTKSRAQLSSPANHQANQQANHQASLNAYAKATRNAYTARRRTTVIGALNTLAIALSAFPFPAAHAETTLDTVEVTARQDRATLGFDRVSSTGSKTGVTNRELPASIESVDEKTMQERGNTQISDAIVRTTGLTAIGSPGNGGMSFSSRGFTGVNSVGVAEDGVRIQSASGTQNYPDSTWGYERIEVIRGPASVVYGSGTVGATINAIRKEPSRVSSQEVMVGVGTDGYKQIGVGSTGALNDIATYRIDAYGFNNDGYMDQGDSKSGKLMSRLRLQPTSEFKLDLTADYSVSNPMRYYGDPYDSNKKIVESLRDKNYNAGDSVIRYEDKRLRAKADWQMLDWLNVSNEVYYLESNRHWKNIEGYALNAAGTSVSRNSYLDLYHNLQQTGNRLEGLAKLSNHSLVVGWETARIDFKHTNNSPYTGSSTVSASDPVVGTWASSDPTIPKFGTTSSFNALYVEDAWRFSDRWVLLAGLRKDYSTVNRTDLVNGSKFSSDLVGTTSRVGLSGAATLMTLAGIVIGFQRLRAGKRRYAEGRRSPYRDLPRWIHHIGGLLVALPLLLWLFSGWLSLAPMGFPKATRLSPQEMQQRHSHGLPQPVLDFHPALESLGDYREIEWSQFASVPVVYLRDQRTPVHITAAEPHTLRAGYTDDELYARIVSLFPGHTPIDAKRIDTPDDEYYPHHTRETRFPVYRVRFNDDAHTVYYVDPDDAKIVKKIDDPGRRHRWLFRALHLFDFPPLDRNELARQALVWGFSLLGVLIAGLGCYVWGKRIFKGMTRESRGR